MAMKSQARAELARRELQKRKEIISLAPSPIISDEVAKHIEQRNTELLKLIAGVAENGNKQSESINSAIELLKKSIEGLTKSTAEVTEKSSRASSAKLDVHMADINSTIEAVMESITTLAESFAAAQIASTKALETIGDRIDNIETIQGAEVIRDSSGNISGLNYKRG